MKFICNSCSKIHPITDLRWKCDCGGYLICDYKTKFIKEDIKTDRMNMWRYDEAYPIKYNDLKVTYNEGLTPLVRIPANDCDIRLKLDSLMPTGSFKDRGTVMVVNFLMNNGVSKITEDSSGNEGHQLLHIVH